MKMKKTIPALPVQDIKQSMEFYTNKLGFTVRHHDDGFCIVVYKIPLIVLYPEPEGQELFFSSS
jgi:catechol 2,3-dioxygenase-like lactoylglutathione lyase family enzyme